MRSNVSELMLLAELASSLPDFLLLYAQTEELFTDLAIHHVLACCFAACRARCASPTTSTSGSARQQCHSNAVFCVINVDSDNVAWPLC